MTQLEKVSTALEVVKAFAHMPMKTQEEKKAYEVALSVLTAAMGK